MSHGITVCKELAFLFSILTDTSYEPSMSELRIRLMSFSMFRVDPDPPAGQLMQVFHTFLSLHFVLEMASHSYAESCLFVPAEGYPTMEVCVHH